MVSLSFFEHMAFALKFYGQTSIQNIKELLGYIMVVCFLLAIWGHGLLYYT